MFYIPFFTGLGLLPALPLSQPQLRWLVLYSVPLLVEDSSGSGGCVCGLCYASGLCWPFYKIGVVIVVSLSMNLLLFRFYSSQLWKLKKKSLSS